MSTAFARNSSILKKKLRILVFRCFEIIIRFFWNVSSKGMATTSLAIKI